MRLFELLLMLLPASSVLAQDSLTEVVPGRRVGPVRPSSTAASLRALLGPLKAQPADLDIGEGFTEPGLILFSTDSSRRAFVYWRDTLALEHPAGVLISDAATRWRLPLDLTVGTSLQDLERLNGRPFTFIGLAWDYGGRVSSWNGGSLEEAFGPTFHFHPSLSAACPEQVSAEEYSQIVGDREVSSAHPVARAACVRVAELWIAIDPPP